jgi:hypothetical protein
LGFDKRRMAFERIDRPEDPFEGGFGVSDFFPEFLTHEELLSRELEE